MNENNLKAIEELWTLDGFSGYLDFIIVIDLEKNGFLIYDINDKKKVKTDIGLEKNLIKCTLTKKGKEYRLAQFQEFSHKIIFERDGQLLKSPVGDLIKKLDCPIDQDCINLKPVPDSLIKKFCNECNKNVLDINNMTISEVRTIVRYDPEVCFCFNNAAKYIDFIDEHKDLRVIYTARSVESMNEAVKHGYFPLIIDVDNSKKFGHSIYIKQNEETGEVTSTRLGHFNMQVNEAEYGKRYWWGETQFNFPIAAYLIPSDLKEGEEVWLYDLIENYSISVANYNDTISRRMNAKAIWNGKEFEIMEEKNAGPYIVG